MVQTEALMKLRSQTAETRNKSSSKVQPFAQKRTTDTHPYSFRVNQVIVKSQCSQSAETLIFKVPAYNSVCGEIWVEFTLPDLAAAPDRYNPSCVIDMVREVRLKHSDQF